MPVNDRVRALAQSLDFAGIERTHGLPAGILTNLINQESGGRTDAVSRTGARGIAQFMPATAAQYGVNVNDDRSSVNGAARFLEDLMDRFNGDPRKAIAAYNCGQGRVERLVRQYGDQWDQHLPGETTNYLRIVGDGIGPGYVARAADAARTGNPLPQDVEDAERARRAARLREAGFNDQTINALSSNDMLGVLFFALIRSFVENRINNAETDRLRTGEFVSEPSNPEREFGSNTMDRVRALKAQNAATGAAPQTPVTVDTGTPAPTGVAPQTPAPGPGGAVPAPARTGTNR